MPHSHQTSGKAGGLEIDILREVRRQDAAGSSQSPVRAKETSPGPTRGRSSGPPSPRAPPWVRVSTDFISSPPESPLFRRFGGRGTERGDSLSNPESGVSLLLQCLSERSVSLHLDTLWPPHPCPLPQHGKAVGGEGRNSWELDPGRPQRLEPLPAPWATVRRPAGAHKEKAASCRFTNVQSAASAEALGYFQALFRSTFS